MEIKVKKVGAGGSTGDKGQKGEVVCKFKRTGEKGQIEVGFQRWSDGDKGQKGEVGATDSRIIKLKDIGLWSGG